jgi:predicted amidohydrolase YtcJ
MLDRVDVHCIWVSNKVISLLPADIGEIPGGEIPAKGVFCDNAMDVVLKHYPKPSQDTKAKFVKNAMRELNTHGIVGMHDAGVNPSDLKLYNKLSSDEDWTVRVNAMVECEERNTFCPADVKKVYSPIGKFRVRSVKLFAGQLLSQDATCID